jgi:hypothetical protein
VRPLLGGLDAWVAAGHEVELRPGVQERAAGAALPSSPRVAA